MSSGNRGLRLVIITVVLGTLAVCGILLYTSFFPFPEGKQDTSDGVSKFTENGQESSPSANLHDSDVMYATSSAGFITQVTFEPAGTINDENRKLLTDRVILPFIEYHDRTASGSSISALTVTKNQSVTRNSIPYLLSAILPDGTYLSYPILAGIPVWQPAD